MAIALDDLEFNNVLLGIPKAVNPHDPLYSALFEIQGLINGAFRAELSLPGGLQLVGGGAVLPISFGPADGYADYTRGSSPTGVTFNPSAPLISTLGPGGRIYVRLGGTVFPARTQDAGAYRATIVLTVFDLGS